MLTYEALIERNTSGGRDLIEKNAQTPLEWTEGVLKTKSGYLWQKQLGGEEKWGCLGPGNSSPEFQEAILWWRPAGERVRNLEMRGGSYWTLTSPPPLQLTGNTPAFSSQISWDFLTAGLLSTLRSVFRVNFADGRFPRALSGKGTCWDTACKSCDGLRSSCEVAVAPDNT